MFWKNLFQKLEPNNLTKLNQFNSIYIPIPNGFY